MNSFLSFIFLISLSIQPSSLNLPNTEDAVKAFQSQNYQASLNILNNLKNVPENELGRIAFYKLANHYRLNHKIETIKAANYIEDFIPDIAERYKVVTFLMKSEAQEWAEDDLGDISRAMEISKARLTNGMGGPTTQDIQSDIVRKLDKLIKQKEDEQNQQQQQAQEQNKPQNQNQTPAQQSQIMKDHEGPGYVNRAKFIKLQESWGNLPPAARVQALQTLTQGMHPRFRESIESYFRLLANTPNRKR